MCASTPPPADRHLSLISSDGHTACVFSSSSDPLSAGDEVRWKDGFSDMNFPPVPFPSRKVFAAAGEPLLRSLVQRHHERLRDTGIGHLFPKDDERFAAGIQKAADFMVEATGGPADPSRPQAQGCMRTRHFPFTIDEAARDIWLAQLLLAMEDVAFPDNVRMEFWNWVEAFSVRMINRRTTKAAPRRYSMEEAPAALQPFMTTPRRAVMCPR